MLFDRYAPRALRYANSMLRNTSDAEDVVQDSFCRLLRPIREGKFAENGAGFGAYLMKVVRNLAVDQMRQRKRCQTSNELETVAVESSDQGALAGFENKLADLIEKLPMNWREALQLKVAGKLRYDEIANLLNCSHAQVRTWIYRARRQLEADLTRLELIVGKAGQRQ